MGSAREIRPTYGSSVRANGGFVLRMDARHLLSER
jgi:hypothetical protein